MIPIPTTFRPQLRMLVALLALVMPASMSGALAQGAAGPDGAQTTAQSRLGISLPSSALRVPAIAHGLEVIGREPCDRDAILRLGTALERAGFRRDSATALVAFSSNCGGYAPALRQATNALLTISDYPAAAAVATTLISLSPHDNNGFYLRALAYDRGGEPVRAIDDYVTAIELFPNRAQIANVSFFALARLHDKLGQPCDAAAAIERWVAIEPARYDTTQTRTLIGDYMKRGACTRSRGGEDVVKVNGAHHTASVRATINGVPGTFIVDTGASYVTMGRRFAEKAGVALESQGTITLSTANGRVEATRGRASHIKLTRVEARDVQVVVQDDKPGNYGDGVDGLLGMTFLSRFETTMRGGTIRIRSRD